MSSDGRQKIVTLEPGLTPAAAAAILVAVQAAYDEHATGWQKVSPRVRGLAGGQLAIYAGGLRP